MSQVKVYATCAQCSGTGTQPGGGVIGGPSACSWPGCGGNGYYEIGFVELDPSQDDIMDKINDVLDKCNDILEEVSGGA